MPQQLGSEFRIALLALETVICSYADGILAHKASERGIQHRGYSCLIKRKKAFLPCPYGWWVQRPILFIHLHECDTIIARGVILPPFAVNH